jgi:DNA invertase Pin-like site-specific DNA recombinase
VTLAIANGDECVYCDEADPVDAGDQATTERSGKRDAGLRFDQRYARVSTADQNPDHQIDVLTRAGVAHKDIHIDHARGERPAAPSSTTSCASCATAPRRHGDTATRRHGDTLKITRLDRLGRSVLHLVTLGAALRERGVGLHVIEHVIDTTTAEGRDVRHALRPRRVPTRAHRRQYPRRPRRRPRPRPHRCRRPKLNAEQTALAQQLYDAGEHTVQQIADIFAVPRTTVYGTSTPPAQENAPRNPPSSPPSTTS